jgi:hypothetical protein
MIGFTETGTYGIVDDESKRVFEDGTRAIMTALEQYAGQV